MRVTLVGTGVQGSAIALILSRIPEVAEIVCSDINYSRAKKVAKKLQSEKIRTERVDASDPEDLLRVSKESDVIINATPTKFNPGIMEAALKGGSHYVALASGDPLRELELSRRWEDAGLSAVIYQGGPFVMNVLVRLAADELDRVDEIRLRFGWKSSGMKEATHAWSPAWCPEEALAEWTNEPLIYENGRFKRAPTFSGMEIYEFPKPMGEVELCFVDYEPVYTLPRFIGKGVRYVDCKIPPDRAAKALIEMGFTSVELIRVGDVEVVPRDVLLALTPQPADTCIELLAKPEDLKEIRFERDVLICFLAEVKGEKAGEGITRTFYRISSFSENFKKFGTPWAEVALPASLTTLMLASGEIESKGVIPPECLDPRKFLKRLADWGIMFEENCSSKHSIKTSDSYQMGSKELSSRL